MNMYDYLIVGAGLYGAVFAHEAKKKGKTVLVIDRRDHIAGNVYTEDVEKILKVSKSLIENLYDEIDGMDDIEIDEWIEDFEDQVNDF